MDTKDFSALGLSETQLRNVFTKAGLRAEDVEKAIAKYINYLNSQAVGLFPPGINVRKHIKENVDTLAEKTLSLLLNPLFEGLIKEFSIYLSRKEGIVKAYQESKDWAEVFGNLVYQDDDDSAEAFIDYIEEVCQTKVKDVKHLQKLTGIEYLSTTWVKNKQIEAKTEEEAKAFALKELEETLTSARYNKYFRALEVAIDNGAKYKELLKVNPKDYGLSLTQPWSSGLGGNQHSAILWAISFGFSMNEGTTDYPYLRDIAKEIEAPYSVIMDAYKITR